MKHKPTEDELLLAVAEECMVNDDVEREGDIGVLKSEEEINELIDSAARKVLDRYRAAFEELAK